jgi:hypothetical protein
MGQATGLPFRKMRETIANSLLLLAASLFVVSGYWLVREIVFDFRNGRTRRRQQ